jgi:hypothetical protein
MAAAGIPGQSADETRKGRYDKGQAGASDLFPPGPGLFGICSRGLLRRAGFPFLLSARTQDGRQQGDNADKPKSWVYQTMAVSAPKSSAARVMSIIPPARLLNSEVTMS